MTSEEVKSEISRLTKLIKHYNHLYYQGKPEISDYEFDMIVEKLKKIEQKFPSLSSKSSPTREVGETITKNFVSVEHRHPMLSLANSYSKEDVTKFIDRMKKLLPEEDINFFCELKFDGTAISIIYENGKLRNVISRGDGKKGDDITNNAKTIQSLPKIIVGNNIPKILEVRAEAFMPKLSFELLNREREKKGLELMANPRNATAGTLKLLDSKIVSQRSLDYHAFSLYIDENNPNTQEEALKILEKWGFHLSKTYKKCNDINEIFSYIDYWESRRHTLPVEIDGIVIKLNDIYQQNKLGSTSKSPRWAIAFKYPPENLSTVLKNISYQVGRTGAITPVANLEPIQLAGTVVKRASLHNPNEIKRLDVRIGDTVFVEKGGEIIPKVTGVDFNKREKESKKIIFIEHCPECGTKLTYETGEAIIYCANHKKCPAQVKGKITHLGARKAMDISELGPQTIASLFEAGLVHSMDDLYKLKYEDIYKLEGFQDKSTLNLLRGIEESKKAPFEKILFALGIRHVGSNSAEKLAKHFKNIDNLTKASNEDLLNVEDIGEKIACSIIEYFGDKDHLELIDNLKKAGLKFSISEEDIKLDSRILIDKTFVVSGVFTNFTRDGIKDFIKKNGGKVVSSVTPNLNYFVSGEKPGPKKRKLAKEYNIETINEETLVKILKP